MAFQIGQHDRRGKQTGQRFMTVKQIPWIFLHHDVDRIQQTIQASLFNEGSAEIGHDEVADKHHTMIRKMNKKRIVSFSSYHWDEFDSRSPDFHLVMQIDR